MVGEAQKRKKVANQINKKIKDIAEGVLIVGSVAHSPRNVTEKSDLDMLAVLDFRYADFAKFYDLLGQKYEPLVVSYAVNGDITNFSIKWDEGFETGLHTWDVNGFSAVVSTDGDHYKFKREDEKAGKSGATKEAMYSLTGLELVVEKPYKDVNGGRILELYPFFQDRTELYLGIPANNLLISPKILSEKGDFISAGIKYLHRRLRNKAKRVYGDNSELSLYKAQAPKVKEKIPPSLKKKLDTFFRVED